MSGSIPRDFINDLLLRVDIVDLIDSHVPLKKSGSNFISRCPFHNEKTPSFSVNRKKQLYHCFGCGAGGDAISFLMEYNHLDFVEAVEDLASFAGLDVPRTANLQPAGADYKSMSEVYDLLAKAAVYYAEQLRGGDGKRAVEYLKARGVSGKVARDYALGYAPDKWDSLLSRFDRKQLLAAGLLVSNEQGRVYDRFRGRLMFPIRDKRKRVIGFGGRVMDDSLPKYLNSPETAVFSKGREVYGLYEVLEKNSRPKRILIVEGYMDVIALAQYGVNYVVAALGTATSQAHLELLYRFTADVIFCFDGDKAGRQAAWRAVESALPVLKDGRRIRIMLLPQGQDPDSLVREEGVENFVRRIEAAEALSDYFFSYLTQSLNLSTMEGRAQFLTMCKSYLERLPAGFFKQMMIERSRQLAGLSELDVLQNPAKLSPNSDKIRQREGIRLSPLRVVIALLLQNPELVGVLEERNVDWGVINYPGMDLLQDIFRVIVVQQPENAAVLLEHYRGTAQEKTVRALASLELSVPDEEAEFKGAVERLLIQIQDSGLEKLLAKESAEGLTLKEKDVLRKLLSKKL